MSSCFFIYLFISILLLLLLLLLFFFFFFGDRRSEKFQFMERNPTSYRPGGLYIMPSHTPAQHTLTLHLLMFIFTSQLLLVKRGISLFNHFWDILHWRIQGAPPARAPPKGPDSFVLTYKFYET